MLPTSTDNDLGNLFVFIDYNYQLVAANVAEEQLEGVMEALMEQVKGSLMIEAVREELGELKMSAMQTSARKVGVDERAVAGAGGSEFRTG
eukprot:COSAG02_NODE_10299_length_1975_cov_1.302772_3_plen_90_part_01